MKSLEPALMTKANVDLRYCAILIVEDGVVLLPEELETTLEAAGAETVLAHSLEEAHRGVARFEFSAAIISYTAGHDDNFWRLIDELGGVPVLLCCSDAPPPTGWHDVRFLTMPARTQAIVNAVGTLLGQTVH
jgi:hypothetical protein